MKKTDYKTMNDQELKQYFLENKDNQEAFYAYLDRKQKDSKDIIIGVNELDSLTPNLQVELITKRLKDKFNLS
jgi:hypothetical protein